MKNAIIAILVLVVIGLSLVVLKLINPGPVDPPPPPGGTNVVDDATKGDNSRWLSFQETITNTLANGEVVEIVSAGERNEDTEKTRGVSFSTNVLRRSITRKPLEPEATKRLAKGPQTIAITFQGSGRGLAKKFGGEASASYCFTSFVKAESTVDAVKEETARGNFEVTEFRKFVQVQDQLTVDKPDFRLALCETLPVDMLAQTVVGTGSILGSFNPILGASVGAGAGVAYEAVKAVDGISLRGLLGELGVSIPDNVEQWLKDMSTKFANKRLEGIRNKVHGIEGKTYKIVYIQNTDGAPLRVEFTNEDGSPIAEDEWDILKLANVFIDAQIIPDKRLQPGDGWEVDSEVVASLVDAVAQGGNCTGKLKLQRKDDQPNGDWTLAFLPAKVVTVADNGATTGDFRIMDGNGIGDSENAYVKSMQLVGTGRLGNAKSNRYLWIFDFMSKIEGNCDWRAIYSTDRKE